MDIPCGQMDKLQEVTKKKSKKSSILPIVLFIITTRNVFIARSVI